MRILAQIDAAPAAAPAAGGGMNFSFLLTIGAMFVLMWALMIRPQQRKEKAHKAMLAEVEKGDGVVTSGGIHGVVTGISDDLLTVEIAPNVRVKLARGSLAARTPAKAKADKP